MLWHVWSKKRETVVQLCDAPALNSSRVLQTDTGVQGISFSFAWMYEYTLLSGS